MTFRRFEDSLSFVAIWKVASSLQIVVDGFWSMTCYHFDYCFVFVLFRLISNLDLWIGYLSCLLVLCSVVVVVVVYTIKPTWILLAVSFSKHKRR